MIKYQPQLHKNSCFAASLAMLTGMPYIDCYKLCCTTKRKATSVDKINTIIKQYKFNLYKYKSLNVIKTPAILLLRPKDQYFGHACVYIPQTKQILEPNKKLKHPLDWYKQSARYVIETRKKKL